MSLSDYFSRQLSIIDQNRKEKRPGLCGSIFTFKEAARVVAINHKLVLSLRKLTRPFSVSGCATQRARYFSAEITLLSLILDGQNSKTTQHFRNQIAQHKKQPTPAPNPNTTRNKSQATLRPRSIAGVSAATKHSSNRRLNLKQRNAVHCRLSPR